MAKRGDMRPDDDHTDDMEGYTRRAKVNEKLDDEEQDVRLRALKSLVALGKEREARYELKHGEGSSPPRDGLGFLLEKEGSWGQRKPSWGQRGSNPELTDILASREMLAIMGNSARTRILVEMFKLYTSGNGRITIREMCSKLDISKSTASRVLRKLSELGVVAKGGGGRGHCLDGTTERGERLLHTLNALEGRHRTTEIKNRIERQRLERDAIFYDSFVATVEEKWEGVKELKFFFTAVGSEAPWVYNNITPEYEDCIEMPVEQSIENLRHSQWMMALQRRHYILTGLEETEDWTPRKTILENSFLQYDISNSRFSQFIKEMIEENLVERKRGKKRGEMLYRITKKGILRLQYIDNAPAFLNYLRGLPYRGIHLIKDERIRRNIRKLSWKEIEMRMDKEFDWDYYADAY